MPAERRVIGWREWVALPAFGVPAIKAKIDTGARSSSLHAYDLQRFSKHGEAWVRFTIHPLQRDVSASVEVEAKMVDERFVRSSSGRQQLRPVVVASLEAAGECWPIEVTLANRDEMGFRMLLGRQAVRRRFVVDPGRSFRLGKPPIELRRPARGSR